MLSFGPTLKVTGLGVGVALGKGLGLGVWVELGRKVGVVVGAWLGVKLGSGGRMGGISKRGLQALRAKPIRIKKTVNCFTN